MRIRRTTKHRLIGAAAAIAIALVSVSSVFAQQIQSSSFQINDQGFNQLGGYSTTTNFQSFQSVDSIGNGSSQSTSFLLDGGYLYPADSSPLLSQNWRFYDDSLSGTPASPLANENVAPSAIAYDDPVKLRITVYDAGGAGVSNLKLRLQYATTSDFSSGVTYVGEQGTCGTIVWCYADGGGSDNGVISDTVLSDPDFCAAGVGNGCGTYNESGTSASTFFHWPGKKTEYDFTIKQVTGTDGAVYFFRLVDAGSGVPIPTNTGKSYPSAAVNGTTFTFSINGLSSGTSTEGVTTDVSTTPTSVNFGTLTLGSSKIAAHRLTVSTNAGSGYKIYAFQRQGLLSPSAAEIPPVSTTNSSPAGWSTACTSTSTGCYGYHAGEDVLEGGSTRFAADDSFAKFTDSPDEVAYGSGVANNVSTDVVYRVLVRDLQSAGDYESTLVYIATPTF